MEDIYLICHSMSVVSTFMRQHMCLEISFRCNVHGVRGTTSRRATVCTRIVWENNNSDEFLDKLRSNVRESEIMQNMACLIRAARCEEGISMIYSSITKRKVQKMLRTYVRTRKEEDTLHHG